MKTVIVIPGDTCVMLSAQCEHMLNGGYEVPPFCSLLRVPLLDENISRVGTCPYGSKPITVTFEVDE